MTHTILIVEDEQAIREMVAIALLESDLRLIEAETASQAWSRINDQIPSLILLDLMLPDTDGISFAGQLRQQAATANIPIIMLTAKAEENSKIKGLEAGADDYVTKPFSPRELIARIKAVLRRTHGDDAVLQLHDLTLDSARHQVNINQHPLNLAPTEYRLMLFFLSHQERVYSRDQLLDHVWGQGSFLDDRTVDVHIRRLRKALAPFGYDRYIQTVRGAGYRLSGTA